VGCGTGVFTIPAAELIGDQGCLVVMDALSDYTKRVLKKVQAAGLENVRVVKRDGLDTGLVIQVCTEPRDFWNCRAQLRTYHEWQYHPEKETARPLSSIRSLVDLADFAFPELSKPTRHAGLTKQMKHWHARGLAVADSPPHLGGELIEVAWRLRGLENLRNLL